MCESGAGGGGVGMCPGDGTDEETRELEGAGEVAAGVECWDMCRRGYRDRIYSRRGVGMGVVGSGLWGYVQARL